MQYLRERLQREAVTTDVADAQLPSVKGVPKSSWASVQPLRNVFHRVFGEQFPRLIQFLWLPSAMIDFRLDAILDDESPTFFLFAAGLTLDPADELGEFVS
jgi:hypothetical protein